MSSEGCAVEMASTSLLSFEPSWKTAYTLIVSKVHSSSRVCVSYPATIAEANCADFLVLLLQVLCDSGNGGEANVLAVATKEGHDVEGLALLGVFEGFWGDDLAIEAGSIRGVYFSREVDELTSRGGRQ